MDNNTTVVFPAPLMSAIGDIGTFFARETAAASTMLEPPIVAPSANEETTPGASAKKPAV